MLSFVSKKARKDMNGEAPSSPVLPVTECRKIFMQRFMENDTLIVVGETGCGKSTQIPQFLYEDCKNLFSFRGMAITQPRRVAAISLANRVAYEMGTTVGDLVGFKVRFDKETSDTTKITFLTDGYLMMDAIRDKRFQEYSVVIVDEAHERSVETDVVLSLLRNAQLMRKNRNPKRRLKLIIMSATLDVDKFQSFFTVDGLATKAVYIKGRPFSLQLNYLPREINESHTDVTWITLLKLHMELPVSHHILVFLTGKEEIDLITARANAINQQKEMEKVFVCPLYAALSKEVQMKAFELPPDGTRKIVVSTNLAETSLTIPGIRVVIDSGRVKSKYFEESLGMNVLRVQLVSKSQSDQRAGRAGRETEGSVFRLYTKHDYESMEEFPVPEITRSNLSRIVLLAAVSLGISNFKDFPLPDRPSNKAIKYALNELKQYGAIESNRQPLKLTRTARRLLSFPVELHLARVLYLAVQYQELSRICAIVALSTMESIYNPEMQESGNRRNKYQTLWAPEGDFITFWRIFKEFKRAKNKKSWCKEYGIQFRSMLYVLRVWRHLLTVCQSMELEEDEKLSCGDAIDFNEKAHLIFKTAFSHQVGKLSKTGGYYIVENQLDTNIKFHAKIHPTSSLITRKPSKLIFTHLSLIEVDNTVYMHNCGVI